jgi:hypothetical protein
MAAVAYESQAVADLRALPSTSRHAAAMASMPHALRHGGIENVPTALTTILRTADPPPACAVFGCGCLLDLDRATDADASLSSGSSIPALVDGRRPASRCSIFISRAGRDQFRP